MEKYYNINYYCSYKLLFFIFMKILKSKNNYELYYSRKIGKSSYMGMEQVCEENCHSLQGN